MYATQLPTKMPSHTTSRYFTLMPGRRLWKEKKTLVKARALHGLAVAGQGRLLLYKPT